MKSSMWLLLALLSFTASIQNGFSKDDYDYEENYRAGQNNYASGVTPEEQNYYGEGRNNYGEDQNNYGKGQNNYNSGVTPEGQNNYGEGQNIYGEGQNIYGEGQNNYGGDQNNYGGDQNNYGGDQNNYGEDQNNYGESQNNYNSGVTPEGQNYYGGVPSEETVHSGGVAFSNGGPENMQAYEVPGMGKPLPSNGKVPFMLINNVPSPQKPNLSAEQELVNDATAALPAQTAVSLQNMLSSPQLMNVLCASILGPNYGYATEQGFCTNSGAS